MTPTTTAALSAAFVTAIHEIAPRYAHAAGERWKYTPSGRDRGRAEGLAGATLRSFELIWGPGLPTLRCFHGDGAEEYQAELRIGTSYAGLEPADLEHMITSDGIDLRRALLRLSEPTVPGLTIALHIPGGVRDTDDASNAYVEHLFSVTWCQDTNQT